MESVWMVTTLHPGCESNVTGGDGQQLRSHSFKCNDRGGCHSPLPPLSLSLSLTFIVHLFQDQAQYWEVIAKGEKNMSALCTMRELAIVGGRGSQLNAFNK